MDDDGRLTARQRRRSLFRRSVANWPPMSPLSLILNLLWLICGGLPAAFGWLIAAGLMVITIIGLPWSFAALRIALYALLPFGQEMRSRPDAGLLSTLGNIVWFVLAGWWLAIIHLVLALA